MILTAIVGFVLCLPQQATGDWPGWGGSRGDFRVSSLDAFANQPLRSQWSVEVGDGESGVVANANRVFVTSLIRQAAEFKEEQELFERVVAIDRKTGDVAWSKQYRVERLKNQESFGASKRSPKATPVLAGNRLVTLGFTGELKCWGTTDGKLLWEHDLVEDFGAKPVQFGFSGSPVADANDVFVLIGGEKGGLSCLDASDGRQSWVLPLKDMASYATPVLCTLAGTRQVVCQSRNKVIGVNRANGKELWEWSLPKSGLTNVPTPLPVSKDRVLVSGQGCEGTGCLQIAKTGTAWTAKQLWLTKRVEFFYCNWLAMDDKSVIGCNDKLLFGLNIDDGTITGRWRGYGDANLLAGKNTVVAMHGDGKMSFLKRSVDSLELQRRVQVTNKRCWTPPTIVGDQMFVRSGKNLQCVTPLGSGEKLAAIETKPEIYAFGSTNPTRDYVGEIVAEFEKSGAEGAFGLYQKFDADGTKFDVAQRLALAGLAAEQNLLDFRQKILADALRAFPNSKEVRAAMK